jgi:hypothetical protein
VQKTNATHQIRIANGELTGYLAVYGHLLVLDNLHLSFHHLKHGLGDL